MGVNIKIRVRNIIVLIDSAVKSYTVRYLFCNGKIVSALCHMHTSERITRALLNAYDTLVEIEESDWLNELKELIENDFSYWNLKHYAIFFDKIGMHQLVAKGYKIELEG